MSLLLTVYLQANPKSDEALEGYKETEPKEMEETGMQETAEFKNQDSRDMEEVNRFFSHPRIPRLFPSTRI